MADEDDGPTCDCKVGRSIAAYDLAGLGDELAARWTGEDGERESLRSLADLFNQRVLGAAMADAGVQVLDGELENTYRLLTGDDVSAGTATRARMRLERDGVDVDEVTSAFVSHQTIHGHLRDCLGVERETEERDPVETGAETIYRMQNRTAAIVEGTIDRLHNTGAVAGGDPQVFVDVRVSCGDCGTQYPVSTFLENGGCDCEAAE